MTAPESASPVDKVKALIRALSDSDRQELDARLRDESIQEYYYQRSKEKADYQRSKEEAEQRRPWNLEVEPIKVWCDESRWYLIEFEPGASGDDVCIDVTQYEDRHPEPLGSMNIRWARPLAEGLATAVRVADAITATREAMANEPKTPDIQF